MIDHFGTHLVPIHAALLKRAYPQIAAAFGDDQDLELDLEFRMPRFTFGMDDVNVKFKTTVRLGIKKAGSQNFILFDEIDINASGDLSID